MESFSTGGGSVVAPHVYVRWMRPADLPRERGFRHIAIIENGLLQVSNAGRVAAWQAYSR